MAFIPPIPNLRNMPLVDEEGRITEAWLQVLLSLAGRVPAAFIGGLGLSKSSSTVLTIAPGMAADAAGGVLIQMLVFTKDLSGPWQPGSGQPGMGQGLVATINTWYHVILANNRGQPDVYFDTDASGVNLPTALRDSRVRRVGSLLLDGLGDIVPFSQLGNEFLLVTPVVNDNGIATPAAASLRTSTTPLGVSTRAIQDLQVNAGAGAQAMWLSSPDEGDVAVGNGVADVRCVGGEAASGRFITRTNLLSQVRARALDATGTYYLTTRGWFDPLL